MNIEQIFRDEREREILREAMERLGLSAEAVIRYFCGYGQLVDSQIQRGYKLAWMKDGEIVDPFDIGSKMALMPEPDDLSRLVDDGGAQHFEPTVHVRSCNRHDNCDRAEDEVMARRGITRTEIHSSFHCHDDECEDCFGS